MTSFLRVMAWLLAFSIAVVAFVTVVVVVVVVVTARFPTHSEFPGRC
jgi:hypothetical protein